MTRRSIPPGHCLFGGYETNRGVTDYKVLVLFTGANKNPLPNGQGSLSRNVLKILRDDRDSAPDLAGLLESEAHL